MSDAPDLPAGAGGQRELLARLRAVIEAKDSENAVLRAELSAALDRERRLELRIAELERRLGMDSTNSGTPGSKEPIGARERRKAERRDRKSSERERRKDRKRGGQPGHPGAGLSRDRIRTSGRPPPPAECSGCGTSLAGVSAAAVVGAGLGREDRPVGDRVAAAAAACRCCGKLTTADAPPGAHPGTISYGAGINTAAVLLSGYGNVPSERAARLIAMLLGMPVSPGFVDRASARLDEKLQAAGFDDAMQAVLADEPVLGADETPVNVLTRDTDPETGEPEEGAPHVLIVRPPGGRLTWLRAMGSRRAAAITAILSFFTGILITDGYTAYQQMLTDLTGIQQCAAHVIRRCRAVSKLGPGSLQSWATDVIIILRQAHLACEDARSRGQPPAPRVSRTCAPATTRPSPSGSRTTGTGTGTTATTPATRSAPGCTATLPRYGCSRATPPSSGRTTSPNKEPKPLSGTRPSPGTGTPRPPSPAGAGFAATSTPPPPTDSPPWTPSPALAGKPWLPPLPNAI